MKMLIYSYRDYDEREGLELLRRDYGLDIETTTAYPTPEELDALAGKGFDIISIPVSNMNRSALEKLRSAGVHYIATRSIGYDHIDLESARELGICVCNSAYPPDSVADFTVMLILMALRKVKPLLDRTAVQDYTLRGKLGRDLAHCTVGIVGTGSIGCAVIKRLRAFGCRLIACSPHRKEEIEDFVEYMSLDELLTEADIVSIHAPSNASTRHMFSTREFSLMRSDALIVNTSRGDLIDSEALITAIEEGQIAGAALDVVENEFEMFYLDKVGVPVRNRALALLRSFPNVVVTPHAAFYTGIVTTEMLRTSTEGCVMTESGKPSPYRVV